MNKKNVIISILSNIALTLLLFFCFIFSTTSQVVKANNVINGCVYAGNTDSKKVSLMINVYWGTEFVETILDVLDEYHAKCTFFVGGSWVEKNQNLLKEIFERGHEIASHGYSHKEHEKLGFEQNYQEIKKTHDLVKSILNFDMNLFAPPGGSYNKLTVQAATELGYKCIMWTRDTIDWRDQDANLIYSRATTSMSGGDLILMHPKEKTLVALPRILEYAKSNEFEICTVSDTIS